MKKVQSQSTSNPCSISQAAAEAALRGGLDTVNAMVREFKKRHDYIVMALNSLDGVDCAPGDGTFYAFPKMQAIIDRNPDIKDDIDLAEHMIQEIGVALVPGSAFGAPGYLRLSFATSMDNLKNAIDRMHTAFKS